MQGRRLIQINSVADGLAEEAQRLRLQAEAAAPGIERDRLVRKARQAKTTSHIHQWLTSPGLQKPA
jgi:hypothetical protein